MYTFHSQRSEQKFILSLETHRIRKQTRQQALVTIFRSLKGITNTQQNSSDTNFIFLKTDKYKSTSLTACQQHYIFSQKLRLSLASHLTLTFSDKPKNLLQLDIIPPQKKISFFKFSPRSILFYFAPPLFFFSPTLSFPPTL